MPDEEAYLMRKSPGPIADAFGMPVFSLCPLTQ